MTRAVGHAPVLDADKLDARRETPGHGGRGRRAGDDAGGGRRAGDDAAGGRGPGDDARGVLGGAPCVRRGGSEGRKAAE